jgi:hypothetical protein
LIIEGKWILNATIQIYNSLGQLVLKVKNKTELVLDIDVSTLKSGMYFIQENQKDITYCNKFYKK